MFYLKTKRGFENFGRAISRLPPSLTVGLVHIYLPFTLMSSQFYWVRP